ncbi:MAG TPA: peptidylprolyl isomerase, partial [Pyrinomonadaceae bacterium]|nr:peptidylprolyl isomerase [Pyrinomonadaceae bacterium]
ERSKAEMKVKMQQVQFLARLAAEEIGPELTVSDAEVAAYIAQHPEFDSKTALDKATKIRDRARAGEDFAALANEFTEDPGNDGDNGKKNGGLYANVAKGVMVPQFEKATLALEPGQVSDVVQSDYGYHVIKLERKSVDGSRYDVRHILIGTGYKDPDDPNGRAIPATLYVRTKLEVDLEAKVINRILAENPVTVEDIRLPVTPPSRPATTRPATATRPATRKR